MSQNNSLLDIINVTESPLEEMELYDKELEQDIVYALKVYISPVILFLGTIGNVLSFVIFSRESLRDSNISFYFRCEK